MKVWFREPVNQTSVYLVGENNGKIVAYVKFNVTANNSKELDEVQE